MRYSVLLLAFAACVAHAADKPAFTGPDFSGVYDCQGMDSKEGAYTGTVTFKLVPEQSYGSYGAYSFRLDVPGYGAYLGQAAADGRVVGIHFALTDQSGKDYGTGIARFSKGKSGKWRFSKYYYEPEFKGGNYGTENCTLR